MRDVNLKGIFVFVFGNLLFSLTMLFIVVDETFPEILLALFNLVLEWQVREDFICLFWWENLAENGRFLSMTTFFYI